MKLTPKAIALGASALLGTIGCFLPVVGGLTLSKLSDLPGYSSKPSLFIFLVPFLFLLALGAVSLQSQRVARWQGIVGTLFALGIVMFLDGAIFHGKFKPMGFLTMFSDGNIGAKLLVVGGVVALVTCLIVTVKPDPKVR